MVSEQKCSKCLIVKRASDFYVLRGSFSGLQRYCKSCAQVYRTANRGKFNASARRSYKRMLLKNPEFSAKNRQRTLEYYYSLSVSERRRRRKEQYKKDPAGAVISVREWREKNPEKAALSKAKDHSRRKAAWILGDEVTTDDLINKLRDQRHLCFYCGTEIETDFHLDHFIPISKNGAHSLNNLVFACQKCNLTKYNLLPGVFCIEAKSWAAA